MSENRQEQFPTGPSRDPPPRVTSPNIARGPIHVPIPRGYPMPGYEMTQMSVESSRMGPLIHLPARTENGNSPSSNRPLLEGQPVRYMVDQTRMPPQNAALASSAEANPGMDRIRSSMDSNMDTTEDRGDIGHVANLMRPARGASMRGSLSTSPQMSGRLTGANHTIHYVPLGPSLRDPVIVAQVNPGFPSSQYNTGFPSSASFASNQPNPGFPSSRSNTDFPSSYSNTALTSNSQSNSDAPSSTFNTGFPGSRSNAEFSTRQSNIGYRRSQSDTGFPSSQSNTVIPGSHSDPGFPSSYSIAGFHNSQSNIGFPRNDANNSNPTSHSNTVSSSNQSNTSLPSSESVTGIPSSQSNINFSSHQSNAGFPSRDSDTGIPNSLSNISIPNESITGIPSSQSITDFSSHQSNTGFPSRDSDTGIPISQSNVSLPCESVSGIPSTQSITGLPSSQSKTGFPSNDSTTGFPNIQSNTSLSSSQSNQGFLSNQPNTGLPSPQSFPGVSQVTPVLNQQQQPTREYNTVSLCRFGQETIQDIVSRTQDVFQMLKMIRPPNGTVSGEKNSEDKKAKVQEQLRTIKLLFKRLRLIHEKCDETCSQGQDFIKVEDLIPVEEDEEPNVVVEEKKSSDSYKLVCQENKELINQVMLKNQHLKEIIDNLRNIIWRTNVMLTTRN